MLTPKSEASRTLSSPFARRGSIRLGALAAIAAALAVVLWIALDGSGSKTAAPTTSGQGIPLPISVAGLRTLAKAVPSPIYWLGSMTDVGYELTKTAGGSVFIRYLPSGVEVGADERYLTVATYPLTNAYAATERAAAQEGAVPVSVQPGAIAFYNRARPESVYFSEQGSDYQVEIYDPSAARARELVASRLVQPVVDNAQSRAAATSAARLKALAKTLDHPLYWAGEKPGYTYELTRSSDGRIFVRYLPKGVAVGSDTPYLTVATYPLTDAFAAVERAAAESGAQATGLTGGGLAVVDASYPQSVHIAYPGSDYQIEVFDPSPAQALEIASSGRVRPVS